MKRANSSVPVDILQVTRRQPRAAYVSYRRERKQTRSVVPVEANLHPIDHTVPVGHTTVTCTAEDRRTNVSRASFGVQVVGDQLRR